MSLGVGFSYEGIIERCQEVVKEENRQCRVPENACEISVQHILDVSLPETGYVLVVIGDKTGYVLVVIEDKAGYVLVVIGVRQDMSLWLL